MTFLSVTPPDLERELERLRAEYREMGIPDAITDPAIDAVRDQYAYLERLTVSPLSLTPTGMAALSGDFNMTREQFKSYVASLTPNYGEPK